MSETHKAYLEIYRSSEYLFSVLDVADENKVSVLTEEHQSAYVHGLINQAIRCLRDAGYDVGVHTEWVWSYEHQCLVTEVQEKQLSSEPEEITVNGKRYRLVSDDVNDALNRRD